MQAFLKFTIIMLLFSGTLSAQVSRKIRISLDLGLNTSFGPDTDQEVKSSDGFFALEWYDRLHYQYPAFVVRADATVPLSAIFSIGFRTGVDVHYLERGDYFGNTYGGVQPTIPLLAVLQARVLKIGTSKGLFASGAYGYRTNKRDFGPFHHRGGSMYSFELLLAKFSSTPAFHVRTGLEFALQNDTYHYVSRINPGHEEYMHYLTRRQTFYVTIGYSF